MTKVSYGETGERPFRLRDLSEILLPLYDVPEDEWPIYLEACRQSAEKGWWQTYDEDVVPGWYAYYLGLEQGASTLVGFVTHLIPGLLQTPTYARAIMTSTATGLDTEDAAGRTEVRLRRQQVLNREPEPLTAHYVLDEAVLRRVVGGPEVMREQLAHLVEAADRSNVTLQVLLFKQGYAFDGAGEPVILGFHWPDDPGVVFLEERIDGKYLEKPHEVADFTKGFAHLHRVALSPVESVAMIKKLAEDHQ